MLKALLATALVLVLAGCASHARIDDAPPSDHGANVVLTALNFLEVPYRRGGNSNTGFDCSGFTRHVFERSIGLQLPRSADEQAAAPNLVEIRRDDLRAGDMVFFNTLGPTYSHVGIYIGDGRFIHAPKSGAQVRVENMRLAYWARRYSGARRAAGTVAEASKP